MNASPLLNPNGQLLPEIVKRLFLARKTKPLWTKRVEVKQEVNTLEGRLEVSPGDYLCRGIRGEYWPQKQAKLLDKYVPTDEFNVDGWQRFDPKPGVAPVEVAQIETDFRVTAQWGELKGKAQDYVVRSTTDPKDIWLVDKAIFEASYEAIEQYPNDISKRQ
jgi:hypothetical protein